MDNKISNQTENEVSLNLTEGKEVSSGSCVCSKGIFCKYHYSQVYYQIHRKDILQKQKDKYKEKKKNERALIIQFGKFVVNFD
jgi:hypothetical protein